LQRDSLLLKEIRSALSGQVDSVRIFRFYWSGRNGFFDRAKAVERMRKKLRMRIQRFPNAKHFVLAHSHGGTVGMEAISDPEIKPHIAGTIYMATPFIVAFERKAQVPAVTALTTSLCLIAVAISVAWFYPIFSGFFAGPDGPAPTVVNFIGAVLLGTAASILLGFCLFGVWAGLGTFDDKARVSLLRADILDRPPSLLIRKAGDEASAILIFCQVISRITHLVWLSSESAAQAFKRVYARRRALVSGALSLILTVSLLTAHYFFVHDPAEHHTSFELGVLAAATLGNWAQFWVLSPVLRFIPLVFSGVLYALLFPINFISLWLFAPAFSFTWSLNFSVESTPLGESSVFLVAPLKEHYLYHSESMKIP
jgi:hypothetical protein